VQFRSPGHVFSGLQSGREKSENSNSEIPNSSEAWMKRRVSIFGRANLFRDSGFVFVVCKDNQFKKLFWCLKPDT